jgi:HEAT repeat protein
VTPREVANVVVALARVPEHRDAALAALGRVFSSNDRSLLASALWAAGETGDADHLPLIKSYLADADPMVRRNAIIAMAKLGEAEAVPPMMALLLGGRDDAMAIARAVGRLGSREREEVLIQLTALGPEQRAQALDAFVNCGLNYPEELELLR